MNILQPPDWPRPKGYANGISVSGRMVFVAGMVGWNAQKEFESDRLADQVKQALENAMMVLKEAGACPQHVVRMTWYLRDRHAYLTAQKEVGEAYRSVMGLHFPPMTVVEVSGLLETRAQVEIEVTAVIPEN